MADDPPLPLTQRRSDSHLVVRDPPSGRYSPGSFDEGPTPPPHDTESNERRRRLSEVEQHQARLEERTAAHLDAIARRVASLEARDEQLADKASQMGAALSNLHRDFAVIATKLDAVQGGIARIEAQRDSGGARARNTVQLVLMTVAILASLAVGIISIVTR